MISIVNGRREEPRVRAAARLPGSSRLRLELQVLMPGPGPRRLYERLGSWLVDCRTPAAVAHVEAELRRLMRELDGLVLPEDPQV